MRLVESQSVNGPLQRGKPKILTNPYQVWRGNGKLEMRFDGT